MDPKISPNNSKLIAYVHENDIWVTHIESKSEKRLTFAHTGNVSKKYLICSD